MSATDPAIPEHVPVNGGAPGAVIDITKRRRGGAAAEARGRWGAMSTPPPDPDRTGREGVADFVEGWFNQVERSLSNEETAAVFLRSAEFFEHILRGAVAQDLITEEQRLKLNDLLDAARDAPGIIAG